MSLLRGISADMSLAGFLGSTFYGIGSVMEPEDIRMAALVGSVEALNAGVTTILDCCDCVNSPDHAPAAIESLRASGSAVSMLMVCRPMIIKAVTGSAAISSAWM